MFQKCQVRGILPFGAFPIQGISCTIQGQHTQIHLKTHSSPTNIHTLHLYALRHLLQVSQDKWGQQQTPTDSNRHQRTTTDFPRHPKRPFKDVWQFVLTWNGVCWCLLVSYVVWRCKEGVWGVFQSVSECCLWTCVRFRCVWGCIWVFWPCMVQEMPCIGKAPKGKIPRTWHFWNIKIPKPPYKRSLKIIGL